MKKVFCEIEKCLGCRTCELACAVEHSSSKSLTAAIREFPLAKSRIQVQFIDHKGKLNRTRAIALQCRHCEEPLCIQACISGGIQKDKTGNILVNPEKCVGCWSCIMVCPFGIIVQQEDIKQILKCDHCPDLDIPACVSACPTRALTFDEQKEFIEKTKK